MSIISKIINNTKFVFNTILINTILDHRLAYNVHRKNKITCNVKVIILLLLLSLLLYYVDS